MPPPPPFPCWFFRGLGDEPLMVQPFDAPRDLGWDVLDPMFVVAYLEGWLLDSEARVTLYQIHAALFGALATSAWGLGEERQSLRPLLLRAFERQDLVVLAPRRRSAQLPGQASPQVAPPVLPRGPRPQIHLDLTFFEIQVVDEVGAPIDGIDLTLTVDGTPRKVTTAGGGKARVDRASGGFASAAVANLQQLRDTMKPRWQKPRKAKIPTGENVFTRHLEDPIAPVTLQNEVLGILVILPRFRCREIPGATFEFGRSFVRRDAIPALAGVAQELLHDDGQKAMIFGHTDEAGPSQLNKELSERRAKAVFALLTHDVPRWEELWVGADDAAWRERWGLREAQHMLNALGVDPGDRGGPLREDVVVLRRLRDAVSRFQEGDFPTRPAEQPPLKATGRIDALTRQALFLAYAKLITRAPVDAASRISSVGPSSFMGCGEFNPVSLHVTDAASRRAVVLVYDIPAEPQALPCRLGTIAPCLAVTTPALLVPDPQGKPPYRCSVYKQVAEACPCVAGADLTHDLVLHFPLSLAELDVMPHVLVLSSEDGTVVQRRSLASDARAEDDANSQIFFSLLPEMLSYELRCEGVDSPFVIFDFTPYLELSSLAGALPTSFLENVTFRASQTIDEPDSGDRGPT